MLTSGVTKYLIIAGGAIMALAALVLGVSHLLTEERKAGAAVITAQWSAANKQQQDTLAALQSRLNDGLASVDAGLQAKLGNLTLAGQTSNTTLVKEIHDAPQYVSADCALTYSVWQSLTAARKLSAASGPNPGDGGTLPTSPVPVGQAGGNPGHQ